MHMVLIIMPRAYVTGFGKTDLMGIIVDSSYEPKYTHDRLTMVFQIITMKNINLAFLLTLKRCSCEPALVLVKHFLWYTLSAFDCVLMEKCSDDANVTMATIVARCPSVCYS